MSKNISRRALTVLVTLVILFSLFSSALAAPSTVPAQLPASVTFTILHTNDVHGQLEASGSNPGMARVAQVINDVRTAVGASNVLLVDAGDEMQGSLLSNLGDGTATGKGLPTIATFNAMGYNVATFGNHEFDWGQTVLAARTTQATYPFVTANIVKNNTGDCATAGWTKPDFADNPYEVITVGAPNTVKVAFIGVTTTETPTITPTPTITTTPTASGIYSYVVKEGETLISIIQSQGLADTQNALVIIFMLNPTIDPVTDFITVGQTIRLPPPNYPLPTPTSLPTGLADGSKITYRVLSGDSLGSIANKLNSTIKSILDLNKTALTNGDTSIIYPGQLLVVSINLVTPMPTVIPTATATP